MTEELRVGIDVVVLLLARLWSRHEHLKGGREIKVYLNGEMDKKIEQAKEEGRQEERKKWTKSI